MNANWTETTTETNRSAGQRTFSSTSGSTILLSSSTAPILTYSDGAWTSITKREVSRFVFGNDTAIR